MSSSWGDWTCPRAPRWPRTATAAHRDCSRRSWMCPECLSHRHFGLRNQESVNAKCGLGRGQLCLDLVYRGLGRSLPSHDGAHRPRLGDGVSTICLEPSRVEPSCVEPGHRAASERCAEGGRTALEMRQRGGSSLTVGTKPGGGSSLGYIATRNVPMRAPTAMRPQQEAVHLKRALREWCTLEFGRQVRRDTGKMIPKRVNDTKGQARPDRRSEIERHPGNLILPLRKVVRHDPTRARITQTLERR